MPVFIESLALEACRLFPWTAKYAVDSAPHRVLSAAMTVGRIFIIGIQSHMRMTGYIARRCMRWFLFSYLLDSLINYVSAAGLYRDVFKFIKINAHVFSVL